MLEREWLWAALLAVLLLGMLFALGVMRRRLAHHPELSRKIAHVFLGLVTLSFPWLFDSSAPVIALALATAVVLVALRTIPELHDRFGPLVGGVGRESLGELYFPAGAAALFLLAGGDRIVFVIPILTLTVADAVAALIGLRYGSVHFDTAGGRKSLEGSLAFLMVAFLATHVPLLLYTDVGRAESLAIGLIFGVLVMLLEAVAWRGLDNLFIPIGGYLLLTNAMALDGAALWTNLVVAVLLLLVVLAVRRNQTLNDAALIAGVLIGYVSWSVGGWRWLVPPLVVFLSYAVMFPRAEQLRTRPHDLVALVAVTSAGLSWLALRQLLPGEGAYYAYTLSFATNLCFIGITWFRVAPARLPIARAVAVASLIAWVALFIPFILIGGRARALLVDVTAALAIIVVAALGYVVAVRPGRTAIHPHPWARQVLVALGASALGLLVDTR